MSQESKPSQFAKTEGEIVLREHEFDGIQEYDQKLPNWWLFTFYVAIVWFVCHWGMYYQFEGISTPQQRVSEEIKVVQQKKDEQLAKLVKELNDDKLVNEWATNPEIVANGNATFLSICSKCHGADLSAKGPNGEMDGLPLNDHQWKFGGQPMQIFKLVHDGSPPESKGKNDKGGKMQAWGKTELTSKQVAEVVAYIITKVPEDFATYKK